MSHRRIHLLGVPIDAVDLDSLFAFVAERVKQGTATTVLYANVHTVNSAVQDGELMRIMKQADLLYCDGEGIRRGVKMLGGALPPRMTGADWIWDYSRFAAAHQHRLYWLGGEPGVAESCANKLVEASPGLVFAGTHHGYFRKEGPENDAVVEAINRAGPQVLIVGFGTPLQEKWIARNRHRLQVPVVWAVGATADFVSGRVPRGPSFLYDSGFEWLARLLVDPKRLWKRYVVGNTVFLARVMRDRRRGVSL